MTVPNLRRLRDIDPAPTEGDRADLAPAEPAVPVDPIQGSFLLQAGVFLVVMLAVLHVAKAIILPVVLAVVLRLLLNPALGFLERPSVPPDGVAADCGWTWTRCISDDPPQPRRGHVARKRRHEAA